MKKTIIAVTATAFLGAATFTPTPASAFIWLALPAVLAMKKDPNWDAKQAMAAKKTKVAKKKSKKKM